MLTAPMGSTPWLDQTPRRWAYIPDSPPHNASKLGCMLAMTPHDPSRAACSAVDHFEVFEAVPAPRDRRRPAPIDDPRQRVHDGGDRGVADHVESGRDARLGAGEHVRGDRVDVEVAVAAAVGRHRRTARAAMRCASRARRRRTGRRPARALRCVRSGLAPRRRRLPLHPNTPTTSTPWSRSRDLIPVVEAPDLRARRIRAPRRCRGPPPRRGRRGGRSRRCSRVNSLAGGRAHQVVRIGGQRLLRCEATRVGEFAHQPAQCRRRGRRVDVDASEVGRADRPTTASTSSVLGACVRATRTRPSRDPRSLRRDARGRSRR